MKYKLKDLVVASRIGVIDYIVENNSPVIQENITKVFSWYKSVLSYVEAFDGRVEKLREDVKNEAKTEEEANKQLAKLSDVEVDVASPSPAGGWTYEQLFKESGLVTPSIKVLDKMVQIGLMAPPSDEDAVDSSHAEDIVAKALGE